MSSHFLVIDSDGNELSIPVDSGWGPAVLLVESPVDALKDVSDGQVGAAVDRERTFSVVGFALDHTVVDRLGSVPATPEDIHRAVVELGFEWEARPVAAT